MHATGHVLLADFGRIILIFDFNSNENQNLFKNSKISKIRRFKERRNEDSKKQRFKEKEKNL